MVLKCHTLLVCGVSTLIYFQGMSTCPPASYISPDDISVASSAKTKVDDWCWGGFKGKADADEGHENLMNCVGGENRLYDIFKNSDSPADLAKTAENEIRDITWLIQKALGFAMAFIMIFIWLLCCWTCCPCCRCCRCGAKERSTHKALKFLAVLIVFADGGGVAAAALLAFKGANATLDGIYNFSCTAAKLLDITLSGQNDPSFIGTNSLLNTFDTLDGVMDEGSAFMSQVEKTLLETHQIDVALTEATETLKLMRETLQLNANMYPGTGSESLHKCELCHKLQEPLSDVIDILERSLATSLNDARKEVRTQLESGSRADLQCDMRTASTPLKELVNTIRINFNWLIDDDGLGKVRNITDNRMMLILPAVAAIILGTPILICTCSSVCCFALKEKYDVFGNPYNFWVYRTACISWCSGFGYAIIFFLMGGALVSASVLLSGFCLMLEDVHSTQFAEIYPALGLDDPSMKPGTDNWEMAMAVVDQCFSPSNSGAPGNLMDIMYVVEQNTKTTMRDKFLTEVVAAVDGKFDQIDLASNLTSLATRPAVTKMVDILNANPVSSFILPRASLREDSDYKALADEPDGVSIGFLTSVNCKDHRVPDNMAPLRAGESITGMETFVSRLAPYGRTTGEQQCTPGSFSCTATSQSDQAVCAAASNFLKLQEDLKSSSKRFFRCDLFTQPDNGVEDCDPARLLLNNDGSWSGSCAITNCSNAQDNGDCRVTFKRKAMLCNLDEFTKYVESYADRISRTFLRVDSVVQNVENKIKVELRSWLDIHFLFPLKNVVDGAGCGFLRVLYRDMVAGLCYQSAWGLGAIGNSYVMMASLIVVLIVLAYMIWRRAIDNANSYGATQE